MKCLLAYKRHKTDHFTSFIVSVGDSSKGLYVKLVLVIVILFAKKIMPVNTHALNMLLL